VVSTPKNLKRYPSKLVLVVAAVGKVTAKSSLVVRSDNDNKLLVANLPLDLLDQIEDSRDECSLSRLGRHEISCH
jgi:hypothetical protein